MRQETHVRPRDRHLDQDALALVRRLRDQPGDDDTRNVLADLLDEHGPTPTEFGEMPRWIRLVWLRCVPKS